jgi:hypothetical protein
MFISDTGIQNDKSVLTFCYVISFFVMIHHLVGDSTTKYLVGKPGGSQHREFQIQLIAILSYFLHIASK